MYIALSKKTFPHRKYGTIHKRGDPLGSPSTIEKGNSWCEIVTRLPMPNPELMVLSHHSSGKRKWLSMQGAEFPSSVHQLVCTCPVHQWLYGYEQQPDQLCSKHSCINGQWCRSMQMGEKGIGVSMAAGLNSYEQKWLARSNLKKGGKAYAVLVSCRRKYKYADKPSD